MDHSTLSAISDRSRSVRWRTARGAVATLLLMVSACTADTSATKPAPPDDMHFDTVSATIKGERGGKPFTLEIADTDEKRERGLMFRKSMAADHGMIFVFDVADNYRFWMKNTWIPLDIIFLDSAGKVIEIEPRKAKDDTAMGPDEPAKYVIELNAGTAETIGLKKGDPIDIPEKLLKPGAHSDEK
ncbi:MAG TPA: DUF192 domain-containing protein [Phycisphaerae bacterium]|nr:DUF192 domain-containing protein [Phycisphaerae bacterium]